MEYIVFVTKGQYLFNEWNCNFSIVRLNFVIMLELLTTNNLSVSHSQQKKFTWWFKQFLLEKQSWLTKILSQ